MWYSIRNKLDYRENIKNSYRIKMAKSLDGVMWSKINTINFDIDQNNEWENIMVCYPFILQNKNKLIMFYNGNGFGKTGIGYAIEK
jgi:hypothetical protein